MAIVKEWGWSGAIAVIFGGMILLLVRDRLQSPTSGAGKTSASELVDKVMKAADTAADTKELRADVEEIKLSQAKIYEALIRLAAHVERQ